MTTVYLIRHAEAEGNLYRRCHGHYDSAITDRGYRQIAALAKRLARERIDAAYSSDLTRTQTTALAVTRVHGLPLLLDARLREIGVGVWEDKTWAWLAEFDRARLVTFNSDIGAFSVEGGERMADVRERMLAALRDIVAANPGKTVAVFSHGMALRTLVGTLQGLSLAEVDGTGHAENTAVTKLEADEDGVRVVYRDDASHLPDELTTLRKQLWTKTKDGVEPGVWFEPDAETEGRFEAVREGGERIGAVALRKLGGAAAEIGEFRLDDERQRQGLGVRLLGQAVSYARSQGCDTLRAAIPRGNGLARRRASEYGFRVADKTAELVTFEKYIGRDEAYRVRRFDEAMQADKK